MSDAIFIVTALLPEFAGPVLPAGLLIWGIRKFMRVRRLRRSLMATKGDAAARQMEYDRIGAGVISFWGWAGLPVVLAAALSLGMEWGKALTCAALCGGVILYGSQRLKSRYSRDFKEKVVRAGLEKIFENLSFQPDGGLGEDVLRSSELLPSGRTDCHDLITARYRGLDFSQCDIRIQDGSGGVSTTEDSREGSRAVPADVFQGRVMRFAADPPVSGPVLVVRRDFSAARVLSNPGSWQQVETELAAFEERFVVFAHDPLDAMRIMTPQMIEGIYFLDQKLDVPLAFRFKNGEMFVFMALTRDAFDVSGEKTLLEEQKLLEGDISLIKGFLDTMYFRRGRRPAEGNGKEEKTRKTAASEAESAGSDTAGLSLPGRLSRIGIGLQKLMRLLCQLVFWLPPQSCGEFLWLWRSCVCRTGSEFPSASRAARQNSRIPAAHSSISRWAPFLFCHRSFLWGVSWPGPFVCSCWAGGAASQAAAAFSGCSALSSWLCLPVFPCGFISSSSVSI